MPAPYLNLNGAKVAPFKWPNVPPYGSFANTTPVGTGAKEYRVQQSVSIDGKTTNFNWPSSEHAYHAQKLIHLKDKLGPQHPAQQTLTRMLNEIAATNEEFNPRKHYDGLVNNHLSELNQNGLNVQDKRAFDALCDADYHSVHNPNGGKKSIDFMRTVMQLKLAQHPELAESAMNCAREGVLPVEVSQYDSNWATGPDGKGDNMLGILILEEGNRLLEQRGERPAIQNPQQHFKNLQATQDLSHGNLSQRISASTPGWVTPNQAPAVTTTPTPTTTPSTMSPPTTAPVSTPLTANTFSMQSQQQTPQYYESRGGNQRLVINQNQVVGFEFRQDSSQPWQASRDPSRFQGLVSSFQQQSTQGLSQQKTPQYYESRGGNQRLVINQNQVVGYEFRQDSSQPWQASRDPSRFQGLVSSFQQQSTRGLSQQQAPEYYSFPGGNKRLVIYPNHIVEFEYRKDGSQPWQRSGDPTQFGGLVAAYQQQKAQEAYSQQSFQRASPQPSVQVTSPQPSVQVTSPQPSVQVTSPQPSVQVTSPQPSVQSTSSQSSLQYYASEGGNRRLVIDRNNIVGYEFRTDSSQPWKPSRNKDLYEGLVDSFKSKLDGNINRANPPSHVPSIPNLKSYYKHATLDNKTHHYEVGSFKDEYRSLKGDALKTQILSDFKTKIDRCSSQQELSTAVDSIKKSDEYKILTEAQGRVTKHLHLTTSSVRALDRMIDDKSSQFKTSARNSI